MRIDKFLKVSRILKRRTVAQEACTEEKVVINGKPAKPATKSPSIELQCDYTIPPVNVHDALPQFDFETRTFVRITVVNVFNYDNILPI